MAQCNDATLEVIRRIRNKIGDDTMPCLGPSTLQAVPRGNEKLPSAEELRRHADIMHATRVAVSVCKQEPKCKRCALRIAKDGKDACSVRDDWSCSPDECTTFLDETEATHGTM